MQVTYRRFCFSNINLISNSRFAEDVYLLGGNAEELQLLSERLEKTAAGYSMEVSSDKGKILINNIKPRPPTNIWMNGKVLEEVNQFKYFGSTETKD